MEEHSLLRRRQPVLVYCGSAMRGSESRRPVSRGKGLSWRVQCWREESVQRGDVPSMIPIRRCPRHRAPWMRRTGALIDRADPVHLFHYWPGHAMTSSPERLTESLCDRDLEPSFACLCMSAALRNCPCAAATLVSARNGARTHAPRLHVPAQRHHRTASTHSTWPLAGR
jgi:hypothetical protein